MPYLFYYWNLSGMLELYTRQNEIFVVSTQHMRFFCGVGICPSRMNANNRYWIDAICEN